MTIKVKGSDDQWITASGTGGEAGQDGKSAYQIACDNGYTGTEQEWLASLHGADGQDGVDGQDAPTLTLDTTPTAGSTNPVTSGGVYAALQNVQGGGADASWTQLCNFVSEEDSTAITVVVTENQASEYRVGILSPQAETAGNISCRLFGTSTLQFTVPMKTNGSFWADVAIERLPMPRYQVSGAAIGTPTGNAISLDNPDPIASLVFACVSTIPAGFTVTVWGR